MLSQMTADTGALYGPMTLEESMPNPAQLAAGAELTGTPVMATWLTDAAQALLPALRAAPRTPRRPTCRQARCSPALHRSALMAPAASGPTTPTTRGRAP